MSLSTPMASHSRMTIRIFVERLAGKSGAFHGMAQDATPWHHSPSTKHSRPPTTTLETSSGLQDTTTMETSPCTLWSQHNCNFLVMSTFVCHFDSINTSKLALLSPFFPRRVMQRRAGLHEMELPPPTPSSQESESPEREPEEEVIQSIEDTLDKVRDDIYQDASLGRFPDAREKELFYNEAPHSLSGKNPKLCLRSPPFTHTHCILNRSDIVYRSRHY